LAEIGPLGSCSRPVAESFCGERRPSDPKHGIKLKELIELLLNQSPKPLRYEIRNDVVTVIAAQKSTLSMTDSVFLDD